MLKLEKETYYSIPDTLVNDLKNDCEPNNGSLPNEKAVFVPTSPSYNSRNARESVELHLRHPFEKKSAGYFETNAQRCGL